MTIRDLLIKTTDGDMPSAAVKEHIIQSYNRHAVIRPRQAVPAIVLTVILALTVSASALLIISGGFESYFGSSAGYTTNEPVVVSQSSSGDNVVINYTESWCDGNTLYIAGTLETPEPLDTERTYMLCPQVTVQGEKAANYTARIYPTETVISTFLLDLTLPFDMSDTDKIDVSLSIKWIEDWTDNITGVTFYPQDVAVYSGDWNAVLDVNINAKAVVLTDIYSDENIRIDSIAFSGLSMIIKGEGLNANHGIWLQDNDGKYIGKTSGKNCSDNRYKSCNCSDTLIYIAFEKPVPADTVKSLVFIDNWYTIIGENTEYYDIVAEIPLHYSSINNSILHRRSDL